VVALEIASLQPLVISPEDLVAAAIVDEDERGAAADRAGCDPFDAELWMEAHAVEPPDRPLGIPVPLVQLERRVGMADRVTRDDQNSFSRRAVLHRPVPALA